MSKRGTVGNQRGGGEKGARIGQECVAADVVPASSAAQHLHTVMQKCLSVAIICMLVVLTGGSVALLHYTEN